MHTRENVVAENASLLLNRHTCLSIVKGIFGVNGKKILVQAVV